MEEMNEDTRGDKTINKQGQQMDKYYKYVSHFVKSQDLQ